MRILHEAMGAADKASDKLRTHLVHHIVMRRSTGVPQVKTGPKEVTNGEEGEPSARTRRFEAIASQLKPSTSTNTEIPKNP